MILLFLQISIFVFGPTPVLALLGIDITGRYELVYENLIKELNTILFAVRVIFILTFFMRWILEYVEVKAFNIKGNENVRK
ncbi:hypothetical protein [Olivibacter jilunii]|uniref:hypothetical protein n=1 Tax=Olivibacter jilunii TaxID=985016 RepID=UPI0010300688|nr:hypothetical protein [Olivibacter jilunii]